MAARLALSSNNRNGQYVGTNLVVTPTPTTGSPTARSFNGAGDRVVGPRSVDLGTTYALVMTFWRTDGAALPDDFTAARLFTQHCIGGTRVAVGLNQDRLSITYTTAEGQTYTVQADQPLVDADRHVLCLRVLATEIIVYLEGREVLRASATLRAPDTAPCTLGSDRSQRFFKGVIDDVAFFNAEPGRIENWLRYQSALVRKANPRDFVASPWGEGVHSTMITGEGYDARGNSTSPLSQVRLANPFGEVPELTPAKVELKFTPGTTPLRVGVVAPGYSLGTQEIGAGDSYAYTEDGRLLNQGLVAVSGIPTWTSANVMAVGYDAGSSTLTLWRDGVQIHSYSIPAGSWYPAVTLGNSQVRVNSGQRQWRTLPVDTIGVYSSAWSRLATEFHHMKLGQVAALLNDSDTVLRDANSGAARGVYLEPVGTIGSSISGDTLDMSRTVGAGIRINAQLWTKADQDFFFAIGFSPLAEDLEGERMLLMSPGGRFSLSIVDGRLFASVGGVSVGTANVAFEAGKRYLLGMHKGTSGRLMVWSSNGYLLQSADTLVSQSAADLWVGSAEDGSKKFAGLLSHLVLADAKPPNWKLDRLAKAAVWDKPIVDGLEPSAATERMAFEPSWRDVVANLGITPTPDACYFGMVAAQPDELTLDYRFVARSGTDPFEGDRISGFAPRAITTNGIDINAHPATVTLTAVNDLDRVTVGSAALINGEVFRVAMITLGTSTVVLDRGCADTIPATHPVGSEVWFQDGCLGSDLVPRLSGTSADGKVITRTVLGELSESSAEIDTLPFTGRLARPYPPAFLRINDEQEPHTLVGILEVKWALRSAEAQGAGLVAWTEDSVMPSLGTSFIVRMYDAATNDLLAESPSLPYDTVAYDISAEYDGPVRITVTSYLAGQACLQVPEKVFGYTGIVTVLLTTEGGEPLVLEEDGGAMLLESTSAPQFSSFSGYPAGSYRSLDEEEEEEEGTNPMAMAGIIGVPISELPENTAPITGPEIFPIVRGGENYFESLSRLQAFIEATLPPPADGKSAYQVWLDQGNTGTEAEFLASLVGPRGLNSNVSRRILTNNSASGTIICNWALYDEIRLRLVGDVTLVFQGAVDGQGCSLKLAQDGTGGRLVTMPANIRYSALITSYSVTESAGLADRLGFIYDSGDSRYEIVTNNYGIF